MKEKNKNKMFVRLVVISILVMFLATSANSTMVKNPLDAKDDGSSSPPVATFFENYYEWKDDFNSSQNIDMTHSWGYELVGGFAKMLFTYPLWDNPAWQRMKPINIDNGGAQLNNYVLHLVVPYDSDMDTYYADVRFKHSSNVFLSYWIEKYNSSSADFWVSIPTLPSGESTMYMFYDNPAATSQSNFYSVFSSSSWQYEWANDNLVTDKSYWEGCWDPDVSYGNGMFLTCWEEGQPYWPAHFLLGFKQEIRASIFEPDGDRLVHDAEVWGKNTGEGHTYYRNENPSIAYGGGKWFVAWQRWEPVANPSDETLDIKAKLVQRNGAGLTMTPPAGSDPIDVCSYGTTQADPFVLFDGTRFLVIWEDARNGYQNYDIYGRFYNTDGSSQGDAVKINVNDANSQCEPWAAYDPIHNKYFIVWEDAVHPTYGAFRIRGGIFNNNLVAETTFTVAEPSGYPNNALDYNFPSVCFDQESERYLVTWNDGDLHETPPDNDFWGNVYGQIYSSSGIVQVPMFTIESGNYVRTDIVPYLAQSFLVTYGNAGTSSKIFGKLVASDGSSLGSTIQFSSSSAASADWASIDTDGIEVCMAWEDARITPPPEYMWANDFPDVFNNIWNMNITSGSTVSYYFDQEKELILEAQIVSDPIEPINLEAWHEFQAVFDNNNGNIVFDILDINYNVIRSEVDPGENISTITQTKIRLRATFTRDIPNDSPTLDSWSVLYVGRDDEPPVTLASIQGELGDNGWYKRSPVYVILDAIDYPPDTGSGINKTYYTLNDSDPFVYNGADITLTTYTNEEWEVNFWSVDNKGNVEDRTQQQNKLTIKVDTLDPQVHIDEPLAEAEVEVPFWVRATASDNVQIVKVVFEIPENDISVEDTVPPWEWYCKEELSRALPTTPTDGFVVKEIRAWAYDQAGNNFWHEIPVTVTWSSSRDRTVISNFKSILEKLNLGIVVDKKLNIEKYGLEDADTVKFTAAKILMGKQTTIWDNDLSDGASASFDVPSGFYKITTTTYKEDNQLSTDLVSRVIFIKK